MVCKGYCDLVRNTFKRVPPNSTERKKVDYFTCSTCSLTFSNSEYNHLYENHPELQSIIKKNYGEKNIIIFLTRRKHNCFCCGLRFSVRIRGSYTSRKRELLELKGIIKRID